MLVQRSVAGRPEDLDNGKVAEVFAANVVYIIAEERFLPLGSSVRVDLTVLIYELRRAVTLLEPEGSWRAAEMLCFYIQFAAAVVREEDVPVIIIEVGLSCSLLFLVPRNLLDAGRHDGKEKDA